jgi:hypothetical protein
VDIQQNFGGNWRDVDNVNRIFTDNKYRIKHQKPEQPAVYEWKWAVIFDSKATITHDYFTAEEFWGIYSSTYIDTAYRVSHTQRIRIRKSK